MSHAPEVTHVPPLGFRVWRGQINSMPKAHQHNDLEINLLLGGDAMYLHGGRAVHLKVGHMTLFWAAIPHLILEQSRDARMAWLTLPLDWLWQCDCSSGLMTMLLSGEMVTDIQPEEQDDPSFKRWQAYRRMNDPQWNRIAALEVEARLRRFFLANPSRSKSKLRKLKRQEEKSAFDAVEQMADFLSTHYRQAIGVQDVARHVKLHPNYAMRLFRKQLNMTMIQYLTQQRVAEAKRLLMTTNLPILDVVYECGFGSTSQFYHAFETCVGQSPRAFRQQLPTYVP
jgi:AraC-like DNA-binding protein